MTTSEMPQHLQLSDSELRSLVSQIESDINGAQAQNDERVKRDALYYELYRGLADESKKRPDQDNYQVKLLYIQLHAALADIVDKMFGDDAEIKAAPVERTDHQRVKLVETVMNWVVFNQMRLVLPFIRFAFNALLYGRAHAYMPWREESYWVRGEGGSLERRVWSKGPVFIPLSPEEIIVPAERHAKTIHDFSFVVRRLWTTPQALLDDEREGVYYGIQEHFDKIVAHARGGQNAFGHGFSDELLFTEERAAGIQYGAMASTTSELLEVQEWYGYWRPPVDWPASAYEEEPLMPGTGEEPAPEPLDVETPEAEPILGTERVSADQMELRVTWIPELRLVIGVHNLMDLAPDRRHRRPFEEMAIGVDSYWPMGLGEQLHTAQEALTNNRALVKKGQELATSPPILEEAAAGLPRTLKVQPGERVMVKDISRVKQLEYGCDVNGAVAIEQLILGDVEKIRAKSDTALGRSSDRPNQPRTLGQQQLIEMGGNTRANLDIAIIREQWGVILTRIWELMCQFADEETFVRVTGKVPDGLMDVVDGFARIPREEFTGRYDFDIKFATSYWSREADKERMASAYQLLVANPLFMQNPTALWNLTNRMWEAMGFANFDQILPPPGPINAPTDPDYEATVIREGGTVQVHPLDDDEQHIAQHLKQLKQMQPTDEGLATLVAHIQEHQQAFAAKQEQQQIQQQAKQELLAQALQTGLGGGAPDAQQQPAG